MCAVCMRVCRESHQPGGDFFSGRTRSWSVAILAQAVGVFDGIDRGAHRPGNDLDLLRTRCTEQLLLTLDQNRKIVERLLLIHSRQPYTGQPCEGTMIFHTTEPTIDGQ